MKRTGPTEAEQSKPARIIASLDRDHLDRASHVLVRDLDNRRGEIDDAHLRLIGQRLERLRRLSNIERHPTTEEVTRVESPEHEIRIGDRRFCATFAVAGRTGRCSRALRTYAQETAGIDPSDAASTCTD